MEGKVVNLGIRKNGTTRWGIDFRRRQICGYITRDERGALFWNKAHADQALNAIRYKVTNYTFDIELYKKQSIRDWQFDVRWEEYLDGGCDKNGNAWAPSYMNDLNLYYRKYYEPFFKKQDIRDLEDINLMRFYKSIPGELSVEYKKKIISVLMCFLTSHKLIRKKGLESPRPKSKKTKINYVLYSGELQNSIISEIEPHHRTIFKFMKLHLTRKSETRAIMKDCVDLKNKTIIMRRNFSRSTLTDKTKGKTDRIVPIADEFMPEIERLCNEIPPFKNDFIFRNKRGKHYGENYLTSLWKKATEVLKIPYVPLHWGTRTSGATELLKMGYSLRDIQAMLGHADYRTTEKSYAHYTDSKLIEIVNARNLKKSDKKSELKVINLR